MKAAWTLGLCSCRGSAELVDAPREAFGLEGRGDCVHSLFSFRGPGCAPFSGGRKVGVCCASSRCDGVLKSLKEGMDSARVRYFCLLRPLGLSGGRRPLCSLSSAGTIRCDSDGFTRGRGSLELLVLPGGVEGAR